MVHQVSCFTGLCHKT